MNLWLALSGTDPYRQELDEKDAQLEKAAENARSLSDMYYIAVEKWDAERKQAASLQKLVENLRERLTDKEKELEQQGRDCRDRMERMKADYQQRIDEYNRKVDDLQQQLGRLAARKRTKK